MINKSKVDEIVNAENYEKKKIWVRNLTLSIILHLILMSVAYIILNSSESKLKVNPSSLFFEIDEYQFRESEVKNVDDENTEQDSYPDSEKSEQEINDFVQFTDISADTTDLDQIYQENSLNLSIKYPKGWIFLDQKRKNKLDGVTFWATNTDLNPPPYIHLEVIEKYLFNEKRYKYKLELNDFVAYYNDPEELAGQVTQSFYIRTDDDEDFTIKLIVDGMNSFKAFQPKFLSILKSFKFGSNIF